MFISKLIKFTTNKAKSMRYHFSLLNTKSRLSQPNITPADVSIA